MHAGHQPEANGSPYRFCNLSLIFGSQTGVFGVFYPSRLRHELGHDGEVLPLVSPPNQPRLHASYLVLQQRVDAQHVESVLLRLLPPKLPFPLFLPRQIMWSIDISRLPFAVYLSLKLAAPFRLQNLVHLIRTV